MKKNVFLISVSNAVKKLAQVFKFQFVTQSSSLWGLLMALY